MNINRNNYEEFFLLYADKELSAADKNAVDAFVSQNEDLRGELEMLLQATFNSYDNLVFAGKDALLKPITEEGYINVSNYEEFFVSYCDDELNNAEKAKVEEFVYRNPQYQQEFEILQQVKLQPDTNIVFENKAILYRKEEKDDKVIPFRWWKMAAAAAVLLIAGLFWLMNQPATHVEAAAATKPSQNNTINNDTAVTGKQATEVLANTNGPVVNEITKEEMAVTNAGNPPYNNQKQPKIVIPGQGYKKEKQEIAYEKSIEEKEKVIAQVEPKEAEIKGSDITIRPNTTLENFDIKTISKTNLAESFIDQPAAILNPDEKTVNGISYAGNETDNVNVLTSTVNKKNSLREIIRKTSRFITKKTKGNNEGGVRRSILIGSFEIAAN
jgi:hypothetical protein